MLFNELEAFKVMFSFLEKYYEQTQSDDIGSLLGDLTLLDDDRPIDSAMWEEWLEAVEKIMITENKF
jgi:hypothetical protein